MALDFDLQEHLAAIVEGSDDAIITKDLNSIIISWNEGAERIFGYRSEEVIGKPITILMPDDRKHEESGIISRLRRGEHIRHYQTIRRRKDGTEIPVSLTVSPIRDTDGNVVGASNIARDFSLQQEAKETQRLLLAEMKHRLKNCFSVASGILNICARQASTKEELVALAHERLNALAEAQSRAILDPEVETDLGDFVTLQDLLRSVLSPLVASEQVDMRVEDVPVCAKAMTPLALVFHELGTDAVKYGAFSSSDGNLTVRSKRHEDRLFIYWTETGGISYSAAGSLEGFGTRMIKNVLKSSFAGSFERSHTSKGISVVLNLDARKLQEIAENA